MKQSGEKPSARQQRRKRAMLYRRIAAGVLAAAAVALGVLIFTTMKLSPAALMWGVACALLLAEALLLCVDLPASKLLQGVLIFACVGLLALGYIDNFYERVDGRLVAKYRLVTQLKVTDEYPAHFADMESLERLDMRGSTVTDFEPIQSLSSLRELDIRENYAFDRAAHDALQAAQPGCSILWSIPVADVHYDSAAPGFDLTSLRLSTGELYDLLARYPDKQFLYAVPLYGKRYAMDIHTLNLKGETPDAAAIEDALGLFTEVTTVDLRGEKASAETVATLCDAHPDIRFMFTCDVPGEGMTTEDSTVKIKGDYDDLSAYLAYIDYMPNLEVMDAVDVELTNDQVDEIAAADYGNKLKYSVSAFGLKVNSLATELNLDGTPVGTVEAVEEMLSRLPNLERVSMCECGLTEDQMGMLFDGHPDIKFIWYIEFGHYRLRTDVTAFTTGLGTGNKYRYPDETFKALRYCNDLMMLDLGHCKIKSLDNFLTLKKLRVLILADNLLTDISDITSFPDLEYVELFLNDITDVTPLTELTHLVDLNIFYNPLYENHKVLRSMTWLRRLWIGGCRLSKEDLAELQAALPYTKINVEGKSSTGMGWRKHSHYDTLLKMYEEERYIPFDDVIWVDE